MKEIPLRYIKANQAGIVLFVVLAFALQQPWFLAVLAVVQIAGLLTGGRLNLFVAIAKRFVPKGEETQAAELQRFNNTLAVLFLIVSLALFSAGWNTAGYVVTAMLFVAAGAALLGYCIGCTVYYQYKQMLARRRVKHS